LGKLRSRVGGFRLGKKRKNGGPNPKDPRPSGKDEGGVLLRKGLGGGKNSRKDKETENKEPSQKRDRVTEKEKMEPIRSGGRTLIEDSSNHSRTPGGATG